MEKIHVQFSGESEDAVVAVLGGVGDPDVYPHQGVIGADDARYATFFASLTPFAQENSGLPKPTSVGEG